MTRGGKLALAATAVSMLVAAWVLWDSANGIRRTLSTTASAAASRPACWAQPLAMPGLPNLHQVSPSLYRSAQPTAEGMAQAVKLGIRTVVNLRATASDSDEIGKLPLRREHIWFKPFHAEGEDVVEFLRIVTNPSNTPVLVHCAHGADRTGMMCAAYRICVEGWSKDQAIDEMMHGGYGYHVVWDNIVEYLRKMDASELCRKAGLAPPTPRAHPPASGPAEAEPS